MLYCEISPESFAPWAGDEIDGVRHPLTVEQHWSDQELASIGLYRPADADPVPYGKVAVSTDVRRVEGVVKFVHELVDIPLEDLRAAKLAALAERRWQAETGGTMVAGTPIKTDAESTGKITAAYVQASANPAFTVRWKVDTGVFVTLDAATIIAIGDAVTAHVQACFDNEDVLTTAILAAEDAAALDAIDIEAGWPV